MIRKPFNLYEPKRNGPSLQMPAYGDLEIENLEIVSSQVSQNYPPPPHPSNTNRPSPQLLTMSVVQDTVKVPHAVSRFLTVQIY